LQPAPTIHLRGLDERALYRLKTIDDKLADKLETVSGSYLLHHGLNLRLGGDFDSTMVVFERAD